MCFSLCVGVGVRVFCVWQSWEGITWIDQQLVFCSWCGNLMWQCWGCSEATSYARYLKHAAIIIILCQGHQGNKYQIEIQIIAQYNEIQNKCFHLANDWHAPYSLWISCAQDQCRQGIYCSRSSRRLNDRCCQPRPKLQKGWWCWWSDHRRGKKVRHQLFTTMCSPNWALPLKS